MSIADYLVNNHYLNNNGDDEISGNSMVPTGAVYSTTAKLGSHSLFFDGINDIGSQTSGTDLDETAEFAIALWWKPDTSQIADAELVGIRVATSNPSDPTQGTGLILCRYSGAANTLLFFVRNTASASQSIITVNGYKDDAWHLLIIGRDSSNRLRINIDNGDTDITGNVLTGSWWDNGDFLKIGAYTNSSSQYKGYIDNVNTFSKWPDASEIAEIWNGGAGREFGVAAGITILRRRMEEY
ncbi:hypothetical protein KAR91_76670 [Candidatus Pacearchaeota archaeon]|nr:hypothetical protein [Candidatus Pacearchaeota archaeon]